MARTEIAILGAGVTGLAAGLASGYRIFEAKPFAGGLCRSYYVRPGAARQLRRAPKDHSAYRFEVGGGHWIFGSDESTSHLIRSLTPVHEYRRRSAIYFPDRALIVPYPLQYHLRFLGKETASKVLCEISRRSHKVTRTLEEWLLSSFGRTLTDLFFGPFHELYTAGLWCSIAPQDYQKSPLDWAIAMRGATEDAGEPAGYNSAFLYPELGLDELARKLAGGCQVEYGKSVVAVDVKKREVSFSDGTGIRYRSLISTLALDKMLDLCGVEVPCLANPSTAVLVLNLGAKRGKHCPSEHWIYVPRSRSGFHRVGFYSNVDSSFLPRWGEELVSVYVERSYRCGAQPSAGDIEEYCATAIAELEEWGWLEEVHVKSPTWIPVAYTWTLPGSKWRQMAIESMARSQILMAGRYGAWKFQGIAESIQDGLRAGSILQALGGVRTSE
jgi:protoporphyrinogen oxidase